MTSCAGGSTVDPGHQPAIDDPRGGERWMRYAQALVLPAAMLVALAIAGAGLAGGSSTGIRDRVVYEDILVEQLTDSSGRPIGPRVRVELEPQGGKPAVMPLKRRGAQTAGARSLQASSGCKTVWATRVGRSFLFGTVLWKLTQEKNFCWAYPRLTSVNTNAYPCCTDPTWFYSGLIGSAGWFFKWAGNSSGGHYTFRQGRFEQQVLGKVIDSAQPWVKIWAYGDGSWTYDTGA